MICSATPEARKPGSPEARKPGAQKHHEHVLETMRRVCGSKGFL